MKIINGINEWRKIRSQLGSKKTLGSVHTMGCLHDGHLSLIKRSKAENDYTVLVIFVNPTQFNDPEDFKKYPNTLDSDIELAKKHGVDYLLLPDANTMYPEKNTIFVDQKHPFADCLEGQMRPGHYSGMLTIVLKVLNLVQAQRTYFGEKDYQQYHLIKTMAASFFIPTEIIMADTVREPSGLPFSSRNVRFTPDEKRIAEQFAHIFYQNKHETISVIRDQLQKANIKIDYLEEHYNRRFIAVQVGDIRLIDNVELP